MFQRIGFADADSGLEEAEYVVVGLPFDGTASFRSGSRDGPDAIRLASFNFESYDLQYGVDLSDLKICDLGNMELGADPSYAEQTIKEGLAFLPEKAVPIFLGGEHSITPAIVEGLGRRAPGALDVLVLDAHLDLREEYGCTKASHACASRRILEKDALEGYASIGIRSGSREEFDWAAENGIAYYTARQVREEGIDAALDRAMERLQCERLYLSIDLDVLDPAYAPAVSLAQQSNPHPIATMGCYAFATILIHPYPVIGHHPIEVKNYQRDWAW